MHVGGIQQHAHTLVHGGDASSAAGRTEQQLASGVKKEATGGYEGLETNGSGESLWMISAWKGGSGSGDGGDTGGQPDVSTANASDGVAGRSSGVAAASPRRDAVSEPATKRVSYWA